jgi:hypothetical protein
VRLEHRDVFQQGEHAEDDDDDAANLFGAAIDRQHVDEIEDEDNDKKCDEYADKHREPPKVLRRIINRALTRHPPGGFRSLEHEKSD